MFKRPIGVVAADRVFAQLAINAGEADIDAADEVRKAIVLGFF